MLIIWHSNESGTRAPLRLVEESYAPRLKRIGIQNWRSASTVARMSRQLFRARVGVAGTRHGLGQYGPAGVIDAMDQDRPKQSMFGPIRGDKPRPDEKPQLHDGIEAHAPGPGVDFAVGRAHVAARNSPASSHGLADRVEAHQRGGDAENSSVS